MGRHIYTQKITDVAALIRKLGESEEAKKFKRILASMLALDASDRPTISDVVGQLTQLRSELGTRRLRVDFQMDTVWPPAKLESKKFIL